MAIKKVRPPKVQRGVSLDRDLYDRISQTATRLGMTWNQAVEGALGNAFPAASQDMPNLQDKRNARQREELVNLK